MTPTSCGSTRSRARGRRRRRADRCPGGWRAHRRLARDDRAAVPDAHHGLRVPRAQGAGAGHGRRRHGRSRGRGRDPLRGPVTRCTGSATVRSPSTPPPGSTTLAPKPASLTFEQAAAVPTSALHGAAGAPRRRKDHRGAAGHDHRSVGRRRTVRGADRQGVRRRGDRGVQRRQGRTGPLRRRRPRHRLHRDRHHHKRAALRPGPRHGR